MSIAFAPLVFINNYLPQIIANFAVTPTCAHDAKFAEFIVERPTSPVRLRAEYARLDAVVFEYGTPFYQG